MRKRLVFIIAPLLLVAALAGCSQLNTLLTPGYFEVVSPRSSGVTPGTATDELRAQIKAAPRTAVLLPFADYSPYDSPAMHLEIHALVEEALVAELHSAELKTVVAGSDVTRFLMEQGMILEATAILKAMSPRTSVALRELNDGRWSDSMNERLGQVIHQNLIGVGSMGEEVETAPLAAPAIQGIGAAFSADYVIRGRITVYQSGLKWSPLTRPEKALAFYFASIDGKNPLMGVANLASYEFSEGGPVGPPPETVSSEDNPTFVRDNVKITPTVRLDIFMQDARTGNVVFVNAVEVRSAGLQSITTHGSSDPYKITDRAIRTAADHLLQPLQ